MSSDLASRLQLEAELRRALELQDERSIWFGRSVFDGVLFPAVLLGLAYIARSLVLQFFPHALFKIAIPVLISLVVIRIGVKWLGHMVHHKG